MMDDHSSLMMEAVRTSETSDDNYFTRQYIPEDNSELHARRRENLKSHTVLIRTSERFAIKVLWKGREVGKKLTVSFLFLHSAVCILGSPTKVSGQKRGSCYRTPYMGDRSITHYGIYVHTTTPNKETHPRSEKDGPTRAP
jgi:hypothetical protein